MKDYCNHSKLDLKVMKDQIYAGLLVRKKNPIKFNFKDNLWNQEDMRKLLLSSSWGNKIIVFYGCKKYEIEQHKREVKETQRNSLLPSHSHEFLMKSEMLWRRRQNGKEL